VIVAFGSMKILVVSHPPLVAELGASQVALHLAAGLCALGHDARAWSPSPLPPDTRWWNLWVRQRRIMERYAAEHGPFDVIDTPAISASARLARCGRLVVRSVQPELLYLLHGVRADLRHRAVPSPRSLAHAALAVPQAAAIVAGWRRAAAILCLGSRELAWMRRRFPAWTAKTGSYVNAPPPDEREGLAQVRRQRHAAHKDLRTGVRFLWIGRWAAHKGTKRLLRFLARRLAACPADTVTVAGCGPAAEREIPAEWLRAGRVRLLPSFPRAGLPDLLAVHDAGLFTSSVEGWGLTLNEMLESGLPVYATGAGAVDDLRPYFPSSLRPFPPPERLEPAPLEDLGANGYFERFDWGAIARDYARQVVGLLEEKGPHA
jgi:glycosyltransferase involved in cell wall biosynthesis